LVEPHSIEETSAKVYIKNDNGVYEFAYRTKLNDYLERRRFDRIEISREEQLQDATNIEVIKENKIIAPDVKNFVPKSKRTNYLKILRSYGIDVIDVPAEILLLGGGGPHCSLADVSRIVIFYECRKTYS
jgi:N-dimethylarginine dimethylaminohydrolase